MMASFTQIISLNCQAPVVKRDYCPCGISEAQVEHFARGHTAIPVQLGFTARQSAHYFLLMVLGCALLFYSYCQPTHGTQKGGTFSVRKHQSKNRLYFFFGFLENTKQCLNF